MTLLKVYNKNGHCSEPETDAYGFSDFLREFPFRNSFGPETRFGTPRVNIREDKEFFTIEMETPGIDKSLLKIGISKEILTISYKEAESRTENKFTYREFDLNTFERSFRLPESVNKEGISASYREGILSVILPKKEEAVDKGPRTIEIA